MDIFLKYVLPILIVLVLSALFAYLLGFLGKKLEVNKDPKEDEVRAKLAGVNCGGCGYAGCDAFAKALVEGRAKLSDCNPTAKDKKQEIAVLLGSAEAAGEDTVAIVHCGGGNRCKDKYAYQGYGDCESCRELSGGTKQCPQGCMGFGSCLEDCEYDAIQVNRDTGIAVVDREKCTSCGKCIPKCPISIISRIPKSALYYCACSNKEKGKAVMEACPVGCIACGLCAKNCPTRAITMVENLPQYDYSKCTNCGKCMEVCPRHTICKVEERNGAPRQIGQ